MTEEDRAKAADILDAAADIYDLRERTAAALAAERGKADALRAEMRAALETYNGQNPRQVLSRIQAVLAIADGQR